ncbi:hypothetical protein [Geobacillus icigianus]|uniref:hypothetical protein n=1 Tax=Geobacillus icigianus TaxID=1430331 RepID=UPI0005061803|nr:hypothetical protein [Geobacillus icigianus]
MGSAICPLPKDENPRQSCIFAEKIYGQWFALHPGTKISRQFGIFAEKQRPRAKLPKRGLFLMPFFQLRSGNGKKSPNPLRNQDWYLIIGMALW